MNNRSQILSTLIIGIIIGIVVGILLSWLYYHHSSGYLVNLASNNETCRHTTLIFPGDKDKVISLIRSAKESVYVEVYGMTDDDIIQQLIQARKRGVDVMVILEDDVKYN